MEPFGHSKSSGFFSHLVTSGLQRREDKRQRLLGARSRSRPLYDVIFEITRVNDVANVVPVDPNP